jgi:hypothetical protein
MTQLPYVLTTRPRLDDTEMLREPHALARLGMQRPGLLFAFYRKSQMCSFPPSGDSYVMLVGPSDPQYHLRHKGDYYKNHGTAEYGLTGEEMIQMAASGAIPPEIAAAIMAEQFLDMVSLDRRAFGELPLHALVQIAEEEQFKKIAAAAVYEPVKVREELF